ncbi:MAG: replication protein [Smithella sp.]|jgi:phage replication O-like protein O
MASPQKENGYTAIANEIMDALIASNLSGQDFKIALLILRKTYGFNKNEDVVPLSQMSKATNMHHIRCSQVVGRLQLMKILTVTENINGLGKKYKFNKDFEQWGTVNKNINRLEKVKQTVNVLRKSPLMKTARSKDTSSKDNTKDNTPLPPKVEIPIWVSREIFDKYQASRSKKLKPVSYEGFFKKLKRLAEASRASPEEILNQSIENGWQGIFELKKNARTKTSRHSGIEQWLREKEMENAET